MNEVFSEFLTFINEIRVDNLNILFNPENMYAYMGAEFLATLTNQRLLANLEVFERALDNVLLDDNERLRIKNAISAIRRTLNSESITKIVIALLLSWVELGIKYFSYKSEESKILDDINNSEVDKIFRLHSQSLTHLNTELIYTICAEKYLSLQREDDAIRVLSYLIQLYQNRREGLTPYYSNQIADKNRWVNSHSMTSGSLKIIEKRTSKIAWFGSRRIIHVYRKTSDGQEEAFYQTLPDDDAWPYEQRGLLLLKQGKYEAAFADFSNTIKLNPDSLLAYHGRVLAAIKKNDLVTAEKDCREIIVLRKNYYSLGLHYKVIEELIEELSEFIKNDPENPWFYQQRAMIYETYDKEKAIQDYSKLIDLLYDLPNTYSNKINLLLLYRRNSEALLDLSQLILLEPTNVWAYETRASLYDKIGDYEKSLQDCSKMIELNLNPLFAYRLKVSLLISLGREKEANKILELLGNTDSKDSWLTAQKAFLSQKGSISSLIENGKEIEAIDTLSEIIKNDSKNTWAISERGILYDKQGEHEKALHDYFNMFNLYHESFESNNNQKTTDTLRQIRKIIDNLSLLIQKNPDKALFYKNRATLQLLPGHQNIQMALNDLSSMIVLNTEMFWAYRNRAQVLMKNNRQIEALEDLSRLTNLEHRTDSEKWDRYWAYTEKAKIYESMGEIDKALDIYNEQIKLNIHSPSAYNLASQLLQKAGRQTESMIYFLGQTICRHPSDEIGAKQRKERGPLYEEIKNYDKALEDYSALIEAKMELPFAHRAKAQLLIKMGREHEALVNLDYLLTLDPNDTWATEERNKLLAICPIPENKRMPSFFTSEQVDQIWAMATTKDQQVNKANFPFVVTTADQTNIQPQSGDASTALKVASSIMPSAGAGSAGVVTVTTTAALGFWPVVAGVGAACIGLGVMYFAAKAVERYRRRHDGAQNLNNVVIHQ